MPIETETKFKVGNKVLSLNYGWGEVETIQSPTDNCEYPVFVLFAGDIGTTSYTLDGREVESHIYPALLTEAEVKVKFPEYMPKKRRDK